MRVWIVTIGEPLPVEGGLDRPLRSANLAQIMAREGDEVVWWTSTFDHSRKRHYFPVDTDRVVAPRLSLRLLHGCGYRSNLSLMRLRDHRQIATKFAARARGAEPAPDVILASFPTIELSLAAVRYGLERRVPVVLDMRDMWPDIFCHALPPVLRPLARMLLIPMFRDARLACSGASAITGITDEFVAWGLNKGGRRRTSFDRSFPMGYSSGAPSADAIRDAETFWDLQGVTKQDAKNTICFFGALSRQFDIESVISAARVCANRGLRWIFVLCGEGDRLSEYRRMARGMRNVLLPGWVNRAQIYVLMRRSAAGLDPMPDRFDFLATINNKAIEYLSAGLPVISCPRRGVLAEILVAERCGLSYGYNDVDGLVDIFETLSVSRLAELSGNADSLFLKRFTAEKVYGEMAGYLREIAKQHRMLAV